MEESKTGEDVKAPNLFERAKEEMEAMTHRDETHHKETHGQSDDIDEDTPVDKVKGPSVFERAKEEIEALVETIHPKKVPAHYERPLKKNEGFLESLGSKFEKCCSPFSCKKS